MIPQAKSAAVSRGLLEAFGTTAIEDIRRMTKGLSSDLVFRTVVQGSPYLLRIMTRIDERMDPGRIFACMNAAATAGLTPCVRYSNAEDGISITDFVEAVPFPATHALFQLPERYEDSMRCRHFLRRSITSRRTTVSSGGSARQVCSRRAKSRKPSLVMNKSAALTLVSIWISCRAIAT